MLTIIIFTNSRYNYLLPLLKDIIYSNISINIKVVDYGHKNIKFTNPFLNYKNIKFIKGKHKQTFAKRYFYYIKKIKTKYVWFIGDDDRIETNYLKSLIHFLKLNNNAGFTLNYRPFHKIEKIKKNYKLKRNIEVKSFNLFKAVNDLGMLGAQIININNFKKISKTLNKKILLNYGYPQTYIALKLINRFKDWRIIKNKILFYRYGNFRINKKNIEERLTYEFKGYLLPAKEIYGINSKIYKKIFLIIFFKNIISWIILSIENLGKEETKKIINKNFEIAPCNWQVNFILYLIYTIPIKFWIFLKNFKKGLNKIKK
jgi:hypothetical protein